MAHTIPFHVLARPTTQLKPEVKTDFHESIGVGGDESDVAWLRRWIIDRSVLLYSQFQSILMPDLGPSWPVSCMLSWDHMLSYLIVRQVSSNPSVVAGCCETVTISHSWELATPPQRHHQNAPPNTQINNPLVGRLKWLPLVGLCSLDMFPCLVIRGWTKLGLWSWSDLGRGPPRPPLTLY